MKATILDTIKDGYFTNMKDIFSAMEGQQKNYNWLISNYECNIYPSDAIPNGKTFVWIDGEDLTGIVEKNDIQFIWGVFSGFSKGILVEDVLRYSIPIADGNEGLWSEDIKMQHPLADIEIVPWDSSLVILISTIDSIIDAFMREYPDSKDLKTYNAI